MKKFFRRLRNRVFHAILTESVDRWGVPSRLRILGTGLYAAGLLWVLCAFVALIGSYALMGALPGLPWWVWQVTVAPLPPLAMLLLHVKVALLWDLSAELHHLDRERSIDECASGGVRLDGFEYASVRADRARSALRRLGRDHNRRLLTAEVARLAGEVNALLAAAARANIIKVTGTQDRVAQMADPLRRLRRRNRKLIEGAYADLVKLVAARIAEIDAVADAANLEAEERLANPGGYDPTLQGAALLSARRELEEDAAVWESTAKMFIERVKALEAARDELDEAEPLAATH